jgi:hypothetical protein
MDARDVIATKNPMWTAQELLALLLEAQEAGVDLSTTYLYSAATGALSRGTIGTERLTDRSEVTNLRLW